MVFGRAFPYHSNSRSTFLKADDASWLLVRLEEMYRFVRWQLLTTQENAISLPFCRGDHAVDHRPQWRADKR